MNKNRMILAIVGGVIALAVVAMAILNWTAWSAKVAAVEGDDEEGIDGLETVVSKAQTLQSGKVYPCAESVKAVKANTETLSEWRQEALKAVSRGDRPIEKTTPPAFKSFLVQDAKRVSSLHGAVNGALVKPDFAFGPFKGYIAGSDMPPSDEAKLAELQRRWDDVVILSEVLSAAGADELVNVEFKDKAQEGEQSAGAKPARKKGGKKAAEPEKTFKPSSFGYSLTFLARPPALVKVLNALATSERFVVVDSLAFDRTRDALAEALGGDEKKAEAQQHSGRRGRRRHGGGADPAQESADKKEDKGGIVTDPLVDAPFSVSLAVTVYDFGSMAEAPAAKEDEKGASK